MRLVRRAATAYTERTGLASNSLLESLVFAERAAGKIAGREDEEYESNYDAACCG